MATGAQKNLERGSLQFFVLHQCFSHQVADVAVLAKPRDEGGIVQRQMAICLTKSQAS